MTNEVEMVPLAAHEAQCERFAKIIRYMIVGWTITAVTLAFMLLISFSYEEEVVTETYETTTSEVSQSAADSASNQYIGGSYYGNAVDQDDDE